jgi:hypothetical protein
MHLWDVICDLWINYFWLDVFVHHITARMSFKWSCGI